MAPGSQGWEGAFSEVRTVSVQESTEAPSSLLTAYHPIRVITQPQLHITEHPLCRKHSYTGPHTILVTAM